VPDMFSGAKEGIMRLPHQPLPGKRGKSVSCSSVGELLCHLL